MNPNTKRYSWGRMIRRSVVRNQIGLFVIGLFIVAIGLYPPAVIRFGRTWGPDGRDMFALDAGRRIARVGRLFHVATFRLAGATFARNAIRRMQGAE